MTPVIDGPAFSKLAPPGFTAPDALVELVLSKNRPDYVLKHGFTREEIKPVWWTGEGIEIGFPGGDASKPRLTRDDLFTMGVGVGSDGDLLEFVWHVLAWGSGDSRRNNRKRVESCRANVGLIRDTLEAARAGKPRAAYGSLIRPGGAMILQFGPAFFSKFLYFASEGVTPRCLILDARVSSSMYRLGWSLGRYPKKSFSYNWYTDTYVSYCALLQGWAEQAGHGVSPDMFERALFESGRA